MTVEELIKEGAELKVLIDAYSDRLKEINHSLLDQADFNGKKTAHLAGAGYRVKIVVRDNVTWNQERIVQLRSFMPEDQFASVFKTLHEPTSKKVLDAFLEMAAPELVNGVKWCMTVKPGSPSVTYQRIDDADNEVPF